MRSRIIFKYSLVLLDGIVLYIIFLLFSSLRENVEFVNEHWYRAILPILLTWFVLDSIGGYQIKTDMRSLSYASKHITAMPIIMGFIVLAIYLFSYKPSLQFSRSVLPLSYFTFLILSLSYRRFLHGQLVKRRRKRFYLVIGADEQARELYRTYREKPIEQTLRFFDHTGVHEGAHIDGEDSPFIEKDIQTTLRSLSPYCEGIILTGSRETLDDETFTSLVKLHFRNVPLIPIRAFYETYFRKMPLFILNKWWVLEDQILLAREPIFNRFKQSFDITIALVGILVSFPLMALIALAIKLDSRGAVIFKQIRLGKSEYPFTMYKFRTMYERQSDKCEDKYVRENDKRITRVGKFLRLARLDELPQLFNVMKGEMSLVGPRAEWIEVIREYEKSISYYHFRHIVKPGITGWAQVNYKYGENIHDTIEKLQYDLYYISHYSLVLDIDIFLKTLYMVIFGKGR
jgi:exopolysaccharide biosynthesis polyprenyl glycosylphosphotransferase